MGWKKFKEHFKITHIVRIENHQLQIGSGYVIDLVGIDLSTGVLIENKAFSGFLAGKYPALQSATPQEILGVINEPDAFVTSIPVFTFIDGKLTEKACEALGHPNVTHDGCLMYDNAFYSNKEAAVRGKKESLKSVISWRSGSINDLEKELSKKKVELANFEIDLQKLCEEYPVETSN